MAEARANTLQSGDGYAERERLLASEGVPAATASKVKRVYRPAELSTPFLLVYCIFALVVFTVLQMAAAAFYHASELSHPLTQSKQSNDGISGSQNNTLASSPTSSAPATSTLASYTHAISRSETQSSITSYAPVYYSNSSSGISKMASSFTLQSSFYVPASSLPAFSHIAARQVTPSSTSATSSPVPVGAPPPGSWTDPSANTSSVSPCPSGYQCPSAPAPGSWSDPDADGKNTTKPTTAPLPGSWTGSGEGGNSSAPAPGSWTDPIEADRSWSRGDYFIGTYLPTLAAIIFSIAWKCIFARLKEMEPFYQLTKPGGAILKDSLLLSYTDQALGGVLLASAKSGNWLVHIGAVNMILITLCTAFSPETLYIATAGSECRVIVDPTTSTNKRCRMHLAMRPILAWILGAVLFAIFGLTVVLIFKLRRRSSGLYAEANSIAGIATLYSGPVTHRGSRWREHPTNSHDRYTLTAYNDETGMNSIIPLTSTLLDPLYYQPSPTKATKRTAGHASLHPISLAAFFLYLIGVLTLILYYRFVSKPGEGNGFETFMDSQSFGVKLFMTCIGLSTKFYWGAIEKHIRRTRPYISLAAPNGATADESILLRTSSHPIIAAFSGESWRSPILGLATLMAVLSEILVITLTAVPFSVATAYLAFEISVYISAAIIGMMILVVPGVIAWRVAYGRDTTALKAPECIADVFALLSDDIIYRFTGLGTLQRKERNSIIRSWRLRYAICKMPKEEKPDHCSHDGNDWRIIVI